MNGRRKTNDDFVTRLECAAVSSDIKRDLATIKKAMIGDDMQGGIVKKISDLDAKVVDIALNANHVAAEGKQEKTDRAEKEKTNKEIYSREKIALIGTIGAILGIILGHFLDLIA